MSSHCFVVGGRQRNLLGYPFGRQRYSSRMIHFMQSVCPDRHLLTWPLPCTIPKASHMMIIDPFQYSSRDKCKCSKLMVSVCCAFFNIPHQYLVLVESLTTDKESRYMIQMYHKQVKPCGLDTVINMYLCRCFLVTVTDYILSFRILCFCIININMFFRHLKFLGIRKSRVEGIGFGIVLESINILNLQFNYQDIIFLACFVHNKI